MHEVKSKTWGTHHTHSRAARCDHTSKCDQHHVLPIVAAIPLVGSDVLCIPHQYCERTIPGAIHAQALSMCMLTRGQACRCACMQGQCVFSSFSQEIIRTSYRQAPHAAPIQVVRCNCQKPKFMFSLYKRLYKPLPSCNFKHSNHNFLVITWFTRQA